MLHSVVGIEKEWEELEVEVLVVVGNCQLGRETLSVEFVGTLGRSETTAGAAAEAAGSHLTEPQEIRSVGEQVRLHRNYLSVEIVGFLAEIEVVVVG